MKKGETNRNQIVFRADADTSMGTGHLMRCLALAQAWQDTGGQATFLTVSNSLMLNGRLQSEGMVVKHLKTPLAGYEDALQTAALAKEINASWIVLDGYQFDGVYQKTLKDKGVSLLFIDDFGHAGHYSADIVLNQGIHAATNLYPHKEPYTQLLLGLRYALLRREFLSYQGWKRENPDVARKILVTLGGGDPDNVTKKVVRAIQQLEAENLEVFVVVGSNNPHYEELESIAGPSPFYISLLQNVTDMPALMAWADMAVSAGGGTCLEMAYMGLPNIVMVLAENQQGNAESLGSSGISINSGWHNEVDELGLAKTLSMLISNQMLRKEMSAKAQELVDGTGTSHISSLIDKLSRQCRVTDDIRVRRACIQDGELLWKWANDSSVRANAFHADKIPLKEHLRWYQNKLNSPDTLIWILELGSQPVAQIRYDRVEPATAEIDISVTADCRGMGLGIKALVLTADISGRELGVKHIKGIVFASNKASSRAFTKAGFKLAGREKVSDKLCDIFIRECAETAREAC
ncbi:MAG: UDP-2,4-diacetamido-2,4,6-trideoxy-beta-L-altropyranose hydrolase [Desulfobacteraceae bacterium]|nr:UDP-2,4-diacetamido-2,4,6-trideoxy-beta-L-altropyranose hydrolase [Desulfobacteraceae bacterium]